MKKPITFIPIAALVLAVALQTASAQVPQTDELLALNIQLNTIAQGPTTSARGVVRSTVQTSRLTSGDIVQAIAASMGTTFSGQAGLYLLTPTNNLDNWTVQVRDGNRAVDVSGYFRHQDGASSVASAFVNTKNGNAGDVEYSIDSFTLRDSPAFGGLSVHFDLSGLTVETIRGIVQHGQVAGQMDRIVAKVSGTGDYQGSLLLIEGTISAEGVGTVTVTPPPPIDPGGV